MTFTIVRNDIVKMDVDAIVNTSTSDPTIGDGVDGAINYSAGELLFKEREQFGTVEVGKSIITKGYKLKAKYVIHTFAPQWSGNTDQDYSLLRSCYNTILDKSLSLNVSSVAIPLIGTGFYNFPHEVAFKVATEAITHFLKHHEMRVYLVVYDEDSLREVSKQYQYIVEYIDNNYVDLNITKSRRNRRDEMNDFNIALESLQKPMVQYESSQSLEEYLTSLDEGFSKTLLRLIDMSGHEDSYIYKKANVDRKLFSKIRTNENYKPSKATALAFAIALELNIDQTLDLIGRAGFTMSPSSKFDLIVQYHIQNSIYNVYTINEALFAFDQPLLG